jgi:hypothetical protein
MVTDIGPPAAPLNTEAAARMQLPGKTVPDPAMRGEASQTQRDSPGRREARVRSRTALRGASRPAMLQAGREHFADVFSRRLFDGRHPDPQMTVAAYHGDNGALVKSADGRKLLMKSTVPLRARATNGLLAPVDLSLRESSETFTTANSNADVQIFKDPARGIRFVDEGFSIGAVSGNVPASADGVESENRVFFHDVNGDGSDVSFVAIPQPTGVELGWLLGTEDAPETYSLDLDLPDGARLRRTMTDHPIPGDPPRTFEIVDEAGRSLAYITPPMTIDSDGIGVKSTMEIEGSHRLVVSVEHRGEDLRYPLFVDPFVSSGEGGAGDWINWSTYQTPTTPTRVASDYNINYYGWALHDPAYFPGGAYMSMPTNTFFNMGTGRGFEYQAPAGTYVYQATFGNMSHAAIWPSGNHNNWWQGILNSSRNAWQHVWSGYSTAFGVTHTFNTGLTDQNYANIGIGATAPNLSNGYLWSGSNKAALILDWATVYVADPNPPQLRSPNPSDTGWSDATSRTLTVSASDVGTGLLAFKLTGPGVDKTVYSTPNPCHTNNVNWQRFCPAGDQIISKNITYTPAEGTNRYTLQAIDAAENVSATQTWLERIDRTPPALGAPAGNLWAAREQTTDHRQQGFYGDQASLTVPASDNGSGVKEVVVLRDGVQWGSPATITNGVATWNVDLDGSFADGRYKIELTVRDNVWVAGSPNASQHEQTGGAFYVTIDRSGDVSTADMWSEDPGNSSAKHLGTEAIQAATRNVRIEDLDRVRTLRVITCTARTSGCGELRRQLTNDAGVTQPARSFVDESAGQLRMRYQSVLLDARDRASAGAASSTGPIADAAQPWQVLPPGHGATYAKYTDSEAVGIDGATLATVDTFVDTLTQLPIRVTKFAEPGSSQTVFISYEPNRVAAETLGPDYFAAGGGSLVPTFMANPQATTPDPEPAISDAYLVSHAQDVRRRLGFDASLSFVENITLDLNLPTRLESLQAIGIPLDATELDELTTRFELQGLAIDKIPGIATDKASEYAGAYIDPKTGHLKVGFVDNAAFNLNYVRDTLGALTSRIDAFTATYTLAALQAKRLEIRTAWKTGALDSYNINQLGIDEEHNRVVIGVEDPSTANGPLVALYGAMVEVDKYSGVAAVSPRTAEVREAVGGIQIHKDTFPSSYCTSGFGALKTKQSGARKKTNYYLLTAGHCSARSEDISWSIWNGGDPLNEIQLGPTERNAFYYEDPSDGQAIRLNDPLLASSRQFVQFPGLGTRTDVRVKGAANFLVKGMTVCYSGARSSHPAGRSICGQVTKFRTDTRGDGVTVYDQGIDIYLDDDCRTRGGDSGAGVWVKKRKSDRGVWAVGLVSQSNPGALSPDFPHAPLCGLTGEESKVVVAQGIGPVLQKFGMTLNTQTATAE